jgi:hypothetical protein
MLSLASRLFNWISILTLGWIALRVVRVSQGFGRSRDGKTWLDMPKTAKTQTLGWRAHCKKLKKDLRCKHVEIVF